MKIASQGHMQINMRGEGNCDESVNMLYIETMTIKKSKHLDEGL